MYRFTSGFVGVVNEYRSEESGDCEAKWRTVYADLVHPAGTLSADKVHNQRKIGRDRFNRRRQSKMDAWRSWRVGAWYGSLEF